MYRYPSCVNRTLLLLRWNSFTPSSSSSAFIWWLTAGCVSRSLSAAREKFSVSDTARKHSSCVVFKQIPPPVLPVRLYDTEKL